MSAFFISDRNYESFFERLRTNGELWGPLRCDDGVVRQAPIKAGTSPDFSARRTLLPFKKYLLHPLETIMTYTLAAGYREPDSTVSPLTLIGLHPCDLAAISYLDMIFNAENPDPLYAARRNKLTLIGSSCTPDDFCSCHLSPSPLKASYDLFIRHIGGGCYVSSGSQCGDELLSTLKGIVEERDGVLPEDTRRFFGQLNNLPAYTEPDADLPDWQSLADHCLGCGGCSICCPTCCCFDVLEQGALDGSSAERVRRWDGCLFKSHAEVAGGFSFQRERAQRFRYRYRHKYLGFGPLQGIPGCVGCGRCRAVCPAGLDLRPLAERLERGAP